MQDFHPRIIQKYSPVRAYLAHVHWPMLALGVVILGVVLGLTANDAKATRTERGYWIDLPPPSSDVQKIILSLKLPAANPLFDVATSQDTALSHPNWQTVSVANGDTLSSLFAREGLSSQQLQDVLDLGKPAETLTQLLPGQIIKLRIDENKELQEVVYDEESKSLHIVREQGKLQATDLPHEIETRVSFGAGIITSSLFGAGQAAELSDNVIMKMVEIFGWDIDFAQDLREGDSFAVVYEGHYNAGEKTRDGAILAAEFTNQGKTYRAVRFTDASGVASYYTPEGLSMHKAFLRTPVAFSRISSGFTLGRYHPILHTMRAHKGVDYAAPMGTPIRAASNGKVAFKGVKGGYGNVIILQHAGKYSTLYGHMSAFARGLQQGGSVQQGQVIGYVGKSGLATGPHLHYEFRIDGVHKNPLTVALPKAEPIPAKFKEAFAKDSQKLAAQMALLKNNKVALQAAQ